MDPLFKTALLRIITFLLLLFLNAWFFVQVEYTEKDDKEEKHLLLHNLHDFMTSKYNMTMEEFMNFSHVAHEALSDPKPQWTYSAALDFIFQAWSTIGYGYITPQTPSGRALCIFVCLYGIPITLLMLKSIGELIAKWFNAVVKSFEKRVFKTMEPKRVQTKSAVILVTLMVLLMMANGFWMQYFKEWTFREGVYYFFVSFSTIGFGDYVLRIDKGTQNLKELTAKGSPEQEETRPHIVIYEFLLTFYRMFCLFVVSSVLNSIMTAIEEIKKHHTRCAGCIPREVQNHVGTEPCNNSPEHEEADMTHLNLQNRESTGSLAGTGERGEESSRDN